MVANERPYRILVASDFSEAAAGAIDRAIDVARREPHAELHVLTVIEHPRAVLPQPGSPEFDARLQDLADSLARHVRERAASRPATRVVTYVGVGSAASEIVRLARELGADLVVVGTHGRRGVERMLLGSVAERVVRLAPCPVLVARPVDTRAMDGVPHPEPPCPACEAAGGRLCEAHRTPRERPRVYQRPSTSHPGVLW